MKILELRTKRNLSQNELADLLDVSRQSVSKWETDASTPDLERLIKLCDIFHITLDELAGRNTPKDTPSNMPSNPKNHLPSHQAVIGYILLAVSLLSGILLLIFSEHEEDFLIPLLFVFPILICSLICLFVKQKAGYWCVWAVMSPLVLISSGVVFFGIRIAVNFIMVVFFVIMAITARKLFASITIETNKRESRSVLLGWIVLATFRILIFVFYMASIIDSAIGMLPYITANLLSYIGISLLLTYTVCYITNAKKKKYPGNNKAPAPNIGGGCYIYGK